MTHQEDVDYNLLRVSIHTPTKGVTLGERLLCMTVKVSIHTPTKGVTMQDRLDSVKFQFQSTHPRRV